MKIRPRIQRAAVGLILLGWALPALGADPALESAAKKSLQLPKAMNALDPTCVACAAAARATAQSHALAVINPDSKVPLFQTDAPLELTLVGEFDKMNSTPPGTQMSLPGTASYPGSAVPLKVTFEPRSGIRQKVCAHFKPFKMILEPQPEITGSIFLKPRGKHKQDKAERDEVKEHDFKFITHCDGTGNLSAADPRNQRVFQEYTVYKMIAAAGFPSYEVRLAHITYRDSKNPSNQTQAYGFILEPNRDLAKRYGLDNVKSSDIKDAMKEIKEDRRDLILPWVLAEALALNTDFDLKKAHNTEVLADEKGSPKAVVTQDFDSSPMVDVAAGGEAGRKRQNFQTDKEWIDFARAESNLDDRAYKAELLNVLAHEKDVHAEIDRSPVADKARFHKRVDDFFKALNQALKSK